MRERRGRSRAGFRGRLRAGVVEGGCYRATVAAHLAGVSRLPPERRVVDRQELQRGRLGCPSQQLFPAGRHRGVVVDPGGEHRRHGDDGPRGVYLRAVGVHDDGVLVLLDATRRTRQQGRVRQLRCQQLREVLGAAHEPILLCAAASADQVLESFTGGTDQGQRVQQGDVCRLQCPDRADRGRHQQVSASRHPTATHPARECFGVPLRGQRGAPGRLRPDVTGHPVQRAQGGQVGHRRGHPEPGRSPVP